MAYSYAVEKKGEAFQITVSSKKKEPAIFLFEDIIAVKGSVEATVTANIPTTDIEGTTERKEYIQRLSAFSTGSRGDYARQLEYSFGREHKWSLLLSEIVSKFIEAWKADSLSSIVKASSIVIESPRWLLEPWIEESSANLLYAKGGIGKTYLTLRMALSVVTGGRIFNSKPTLTGQVLFIDYENSGSTFRHRLDRLSKSVPGFSPTTLDHCHYYDPKGVPLHIIKDDVAKFVRDNDIKLVIIDSAAPACGGPPEDAAVAAQYFASLRVIGSTSLTVAHESKMGGGATAFGSVFWTNFSRNIFYLESIDDQQGDIRKLVLRHRKYNNGSLRKDYYFTMKNALEAMVYEESLLIPKKTNKDHVIECLRRNGEQTIKQISDSEMINQGTVKNILRELKEAGSVVPGSGKALWKLADFMKI